jgi:hypothetical protein
MDEVLRSCAGVPELEMPPGRDLFVVAKFMVPTDAYLAQGCLVASGVPAVVADANHAQADLLVVAALGGVRVLVPEEYLQQAQEVLEAFHRGDFTLLDDADVGDPE